MAITHWSEPGLCESVLLHRIWLAREAKCHRGIRERPRFPVPLLTKVIVLAYRILLLLYVESSYRKDHFKNPPNCVCPGQFILMSSVVAARTVEMHGLCRLLIPAKPL